jgi:hypothetical protein
VAEVEALQVLEVSQAWHLHTPSTTTQHSSNKGWACGRARQEANRCCARGKEGMSWAPAVLTSEKERWERSRNVARQPAGAASLAVCSSVSRVMAPSAAAAAAAEVQSPNPFALRYPKAHRTPKSKSEGGPAHWQVGPTRQLEWAHLSVPL